jgi:two-component system secretion response regulator SsrB
MNIKVSIIDDHPIVLQGLVNMLQAFSGLNLAGAYQNEDDLMDGLKMDPPDVLLLDIQMHGKTGNELVPAVLSLLPELKIIALTHMESMPYLHQMLLLGVKGYILKTTEPKNLVAAIEMVYQGDKVIDESLIAPYKEFTQKTNKRSLLKPSLTKREKEIVQLIAQGYSSKDISEQLYLGVRTVEFYRLNILMKMDVSNAAELVHKALNLGFIL